MSLFNWFSAKPASVPTNTATEFESRGREKPAVAASSARPAASLVVRPDERKIKRQARREQLYVAVRDSMTHSGVLSASYKFKVLSLDQLGDQFLVMMDVDQTVDIENNQLGHIESKIIHSAKMRFEIQVSSVYWRVVSQGSPLRPKVVSQPGLQTPSSKAIEVSAPVQPARKPAAPRFEPIQNEEVAAFRQALAAASAANPAALRANGTAPIESMIKPKPRVGPRSHTLLTGFEDTEMPESSSAPALSTTQYGDLN